MQRKEIFEKLKKDIEAKVDYNYKKTVKGVSIMKRANEVSEKEMLKELVKGFSQLLNRFDQFEKNQLEFNKSIMQRLDNIVTKNNLSE